MPGIEEMADAVPGSTCPRGKPCICGESVDTIGDAFSYKNGMNPKKKPFNRAI
jgi:hypothetical protein